MCTASYIFLLLSAELHEKKFTSLEQYVITVNDILAHLFINEIIINMIILMFVFYKTV